MVNREQRYLSVLIIYDIVLITLSFLASLYAKMGSVTRRPAYLLALPLIAISWVVVALAFTRQNHGFRDTWAERIQVQMLDFFILSGLVSVTIIILNIELYSRFILFGTILGFFVLRNLGYIGLLAYLQSERRSGRHVSRVLILGAGRIGQQICRVMSVRSELGYKLVGFLDDAFPAELPAELNLGEVSDLKEVLSREKINELFIALPLTVAERIKDVVDLADFHGVRIRLVPDYYRIFEVPYTVHTIGSLPLVYLREVPLDKPLNKLIKRCFDILFSTSVLIILAPVFLLISIAIVIDSPGPVFYLPERIGKGGQRFKCFKFRSMSNNESSIDSTRSTIENDPRITRVGAFLRQRSLDELPQFINVLIGNMSVVGPRPHRAMLNLDMQASVGGYMIRHYIKPGISGWAQVNGWRGPTDTFEKKLKRTEHDLWYIENWSIGLDIRITLLTAFGKKVNQNAF